MVDYLCVYVHDKCLLYFLVRFFYIWVRVQPQVHSLFWLLPTLPFDPQHSLFLLLLLIPIGNRCLLLQLIAVALSNCPICGHISSVFLSIAVEFSHHLLITYILTQLSRVAMSFVLGPAILQESGFICWVNFLSCCLLMMSFLGDPNKNVQEVMCDAVDRSKSNSCLLGEMSDFIWCLMILLWLSILLTGLC